MSNKLKSSFVNVLYLHNKARSQSHRENVINEDCDISVSDRNELYENTSTIPSEIHNNFSTIYSSSDNDNIDVDPIVLAKTYKKNAIENKKIFCNNMMSKMPNNKISGKHSLWHLDTLSNKYKTCDCEVEYKIV
eukprot:15057_1